jgi:DNA-binding NarL/FixJ family response regulator
MDTNGRVPIAADAGAIRVLVADAQDAARAGVRRVLELDGQFVVVEAADAGDAIDIALQTHADVCVLELDLPGDGIAATRQIKEAMPDTKVVILTASEREKDLFDALRAGADGYLLKTMSANRLPHALRGLLNGEAVLPRQMVSWLIRDFRDRGQRRRVPFQLESEKLEFTEREFEVLDYLREGAPTARIATRLEISEITVRRHISAIVRKLGAPDRKSALELLARDELEAPTLEHLTPQS